MEIIKHSIANTQIAEIKSNEMLIQNSDDGLNIMGDLYYQGYDKIIMYDKNITPDFFDLKNKMAGDILQKFSNYRISLAIVGDFSKYTKTSIKDFIYESNKKRHINFVQSLEEAIKALSI